MQAKADGDSGQGKVAIGVPLGAPSSLNESDSILSRCSQATGGVASQYWPQHVCKRLRQPSAMGHRQAPENLHR